jgi:hypothetical protein
MTDYYEHLKKTQEDWEERLENVAELINFASEVPLAGLKEEPTEYVLAFSFCRIYLD